MTAKKGFTLIELLVVISIIAILSSIITVLLNPLEIVRRTRDATRLSDLANLQIGINILIQENQGRIQDLLCQAPSSPPCSGKSDDLSSNTRKSDGTGWVKVRFDSNDPVLAPVLPVDPINSGSFFYIYSTDQSGSNWEINTVLESNKEKIRMLQDGGNNPDKYEVGSNLKILE